MPAAHRPALTAALIAISFPATSPCQDAPADPSQPTLETKTLAIVSDGPSWYFDHFVEQMKTELLELAKGSYQVTFLDGFNAGGSSAAVDGLLKDAMATGASVVYAAGITATERARALPEADRTKPVVAGALQLTDARGQPISKSGTSTIPNYTFITSPQRVAADLELAKRITGQPLVHVIIDATVIDEMEDLDQGKTVLETKFGVRMAFVTAGATAASALNNVPSDAKAAYVTILPRMPEAERKKLYAGLARRSVPSVSMHGEEDVRLGAMAGLAPDNTDAVARRSALNIYELFLGGDTASLPVYLPVQDHLIINASTASATGWSPDYDTALEAEFINEPTGSFEKITLEKAMAIAGKQNLDILVAREEEVIAIQETEIGRSALLPQVSVSATDGRTRITDKADPLTPGSSNQTRFGLEVRQLLFNDEVFSGLKALRQSEAARHYDTLSARYDAAEAAALAFLDLLTARSLAEIEKENLRLTQNNLQLSRLRIEIGAAEPSEVFRWEQDRARGKATLIQRESDARDAEIELSRTLYLPLDTRWLPETIEVAEDHIALMDSYTKGRVTTRADFERFGSFLQFLALENSPELYAFDQLLAAQGIILGQKRRSYYLPEIALSAGFDRVFTGNSRTDTEGQNESSIGIQFSFPIFEGGKRKAEILQQNAVIRQLLAQRERAAQQIEQRALVAVTGIGSAHPNIRLSRAAYESAQKNYRSVQEKYSQGAASVLDILDAQAGLLQQKQQSAVASFTYLQEVIRAQRSIAWFEHQKSPAEKKLWGELFQTFMRDGKITTRNGTFPRPASGSKPASDSRPPAPATAPTNKRRFPTFKKR